MFRRLLNRLKDDPFNLGPSKLLFDEEERRVARLIRADVPEALELGYFPSLTPPEDRPAPVERPR